MSKTWDYRIIESVHPHNRVVHTICEVAYENDKLSYYSYEPAIVAALANATTKEALGTTLDRMRKALDKPVLKHKDFYPEETLQ